MLPTLYLRYNSIHINTQLPVNNTTEEHTSYNDADHARRESSGRVGKILDLTLQSPF